LTESDHFAGAGTGRGGTGLGSCAGGLGDGGRGPLGNGSDLPISPSLPSVSADRLRGIIAIAGSPLDELDVCVSGDELSTLLDVDGLGLLRLGGIAGAAV
jgi:hypothetical protein